MQLKKMLGNFFFPVFTLFIYFLIIFPLGLILKILNKDILSLKKDQKIKSYWIERKKNIVTMDKQY